MTEDKFLSLKKKDRFKLGSVEWRVTKIKPPFVYATISPAPHSQGLAFTLNDACDMSLVVRPPSKKESPNA